MIDFPKEKFDRLLTSIEWSERQLESTRKERVKAIKQYIGSHYATSDTKEIVPVPYLALAIMIYVRALAARAPRGLFTPKNIEYKAFTKNFELAVNQIPDEINLAETLRNGVSEALFSFCPVKCGLSNNKPFVDLMTIDDYFCDMSAKSFNSIDYEGNRYWLNYDDVMKWESINSKDKVKLKPDEYTIHNEYGQQDAKSVVTTETAKTYRTKIQLKDVWLSDEKLLITYGVSSKKILNIVEWSGPNHSPYYKLGYNSVPGNLLPLPPVALWYDLHDLANSLWRKMARGAQAQKSCLAFDGSDDQGVQSFKNEQDGGGFKYAGKEPKVMEAGGVNPKTLAFYLQTKDLFSYFAGNLDALGGLAVMSGTVGQDKMLGEAASAQLRDMADKTVDFVKDIFKALSYYEWHDPTSDRMLEKSIPGTDMKLPVKWNQQAKKGKFEDYEDGIGIDIYSLQDNSPSIKLQKLQAILQQYIMPLVPVSQQYPEFVSKILYNVIKYADMPELEDAIQSLGILDEYNQQQTQMQGNLPMSTNKTIERVGRPGMTNQGASNEMQKLLLSD